MTNKIKDVVFQVRLFDDSDGTPIAVYDDFPEFSFKLLVNTPGMAVIVVPDGHDILNYAVQDQRFIIHLGVPFYDLPSVNDWGQYWPVTFQGLLRDIQISTDDYGNTYYLLYITELLEVLNRYVTAYPTGVALRSIWTNDSPSEIAYDLIERNATSNGTTADGRIRDVNIIKCLNQVGTVPLSGSPLIAFSAPPGSNLLEIIQNLGKTYGFDFDIATSDFFCPGGLVVFQHANFLGTDRSTLIHFHIALDNSHKTNLSGDSLRERTVAIVGGQGEGINRSFAVRTGANYSLTQDKEVWVDARSSADDELDDLGDVVLATEQAKIQLITMPISSLGWVYNRDFTIGDLVSVYLGNVVAVKKINMVELSWRLDQLPTITIEFVEPFQ